MTVLLIHDSWRNICLTATITLLFLGTVSPIFGSGDLTRYAGAISPVTLTVLSLLSVLRRADR